MIASLLALGVIAAAPAAEIFTMPDGLEVVLVRTSTTVEDVSLRLVVRVGAAQDPYGKDGMTHLLEHLVFHGTYDLHGDALQDLLLESEGRYNAFTTPDFTYYALDVPKRSLERTGGRFLDVVTNPALSLANLDSEHGVVDSESVLHTRRGLFWVADVIIFPGNRGRAPVIGSSTSRRMATLRDIRAHYRKYYIPTNTTALLVGNLTRDEARALLEAHVHWPPQPQTEVERLARMEANVPVEQSVPSFTPAVIFGYAVPSLAPDMCKELSAALDLRLTLEIVNRRALASDVYVDCTRMRGRTFLLAAVISRSYESGLLPGLLEETFKSIGDRPLSRRERELVERRHSAELEARYLEPDRLAESLVPALASRSAQERKAVLQGRLTAPTLDQARLSEAARTTFVKGKRILLHLSPFKY